MVTLLTRATGKIAVLARGARAANRRAPLVLEPMHTLELTIEQRANAELALLRDSVIARLRLGLVASLDGMNAAGQVLRWVRAAAPAHTPEPAVYEELEVLLDRLNESHDALDAEAHLAAAGLRLLRAFGYGLELSSCVHCGRVCAPDRPAYVDAGQGGLVCQACGGGHSEQHRLLGPPVRSRLLEAATDRAAELAPSDVGLVRDLVNAALAAHAGVVL